MDLVRSYLDVFESLRAESKWGQSAEIQRFVALVLASTRLTDPARELKECEAVLTASNGWFSGVRPPVSTVLAAVVLRRGLDPRGMLKRVEAMQDRFKQRGMSRAQISGLMAAFLLVTSHPDGDVSDATLDRMKYILAAWTADHWWLTGADDYPMAALHTLRDEPIAELCTRIEGIYQALRAQGHGRGNQLQLVSHVLAVAPWQSQEAVDRFQALINAFQRREVPIKSERLDEVALLSLSSGSADAIAGQVISAMSRLLDVKPKPGKTTAFALAAGLVMAESSKSADAGDLQAAQAIAAIVAAQTAAMVAVIAAVSASSAASSAAAAG